LKLEKLYGTELKSCGNSNTRFSERLVKQCSINGAQRSSNAARQSSPKSKSMSGGCSYDYCSCQKFSGDWSGGLVWRIGGLEDNGLGKQKGKVYANAGRAFIHWQTDSDGSLKNAYDLCKQFGQSPWSF